MQNFGPKMQFFGPKPPFFRVVRTRLNGIISPPYPEATLDNFGFPVGGRLAARRAVFRPPGRILAFFGLRRTRLNGIITSPYPEVTLDTFGFPVGGRLAARRAVFRHRLPKMALFGPKNAVFFGRKSIFCGQPQKNCYHHDGTPKRQL